MSTLKKYLAFCNSFKGRLNRKAFLFYWLKLIGLSIVLSLVMTLAGILSKKIPIFGLLLMLVCALALITVFAGMISIQVKRLHDLSFSGWWLLLVMILSAPGGLAIEPRINLPLPEALKTVLIAVYIITVLVLVIGLLFIKGSKGENKYGKDPLAPSET